MVVSLEKFTIKTEEREIFVDITQVVRKIISNGKILNGVCRIFVPHTTAAVTINENADPHVRVDLITILREISLQIGKLHLLHSEGNSDAHFKSSLIGCCQEIPIHNKNLLLGTWQGIYFCEFDGPRTRQIYVQLQGE